MTPVTSPEGGSSSTELVDDVGGRIGWLHGAKRIGSLLPAFGQGMARVEFDGVRKPLPFDISRLFTALPGTTGPVEYLVARPNEGEFVVSPWIASGRVNVWAPDDVGLVAFRVPCLGASVGALLMAMPETAVRYCRRAEPRYVATPGAEAAGLSVSVLHGATWLHGRLIDISVSGMQLEATQPVPATIGSALTISLHLGSPRGLDMACQVRHVDANNGVTRLGLVFSELSRLDRLCIERFITRHSAETPVDRINTAGLPSVVRDALLSPRSENRAPQHAAHHRPVAVALYPREMQGVNRNPDKK